MTKCVNEDCQYFREHGKCNEVCTNQGIKKVITNEDKVRNMTTDELAEFLLKVNCAYAEDCMLGIADCKWEDYPTHDKGCKDCFKEWLQKEYED